MDAIDAIMQRYSYRGLYKPVPVPRADLQTIMRAGLAAPSGCNVQTTSLIGLDDEQLVKKTAAFLNKPGFASAPAAICVLTQHIPGIGGAYYDVQDYAAAIENMLLAITALGYASCWVEGYITGNAEINKNMADSLGVSEDYRLVAYLPIGVPERENAPVKKKPFEQRAWFNGFKK